MNEITENNIINLIKGYNNIKFLQITWYGGEPLMYFKKIISLTNKIKELNIPFNSVIISNGYLLTSDIIYSFEEINLKNIQITLDGTKEKHDKRRPLKSGGNTFDTILNNIDKIFQLNTNNSINITIRVNIDETNKNDFPEIYNLINTKYKSNKNIHVYPAFVDDTNSVCTDLKGCIFDRQKVMDFYKEMLEENKIVAFNYFPDMFRQECMSRNINSFVIGADGAVYKCWNDIGVKEKEIFNVNVKGILNNNVLSNYLTGADMLDEKKCQECLMLPICSGGCPFKRLDVLYNKDKDYSEFCTLFKDNLNSYLHTYFKIKETIHE